ncbi:MAG: hypothetical protein JNK46_20125 [Methylobacteriaceae bacterium]|nr:hypothetical protein [Methylobacteriaceae bacterium]
MGDNAQSAMLDILKRLQAGQSDQRKRLERIEELARKQRRDSAGMLVMMRATAGDFDERVNEVEERAAALEARQG